MLQTKKRYVGYMYETLDQREPVFDAKGIETVRRDSCPAVAKVCKASDQPLSKSKLLTQTWVGRPHELASRSKLQKRHSV